MRQVIVGISMIAVMAITTAALADITIGVNISSTGPAASLGIAEKNAITLGPAVIAGHKVNPITPESTSSACAC